jgi:hypothetical protein
MLDQLRRLLHSRLEILQYPGAPGGCNFYYRHRKMRGSLTLGDSESLFTLLTCWEILVVSKKGHFIGGR